MHKSNTNSEKIFDNNNENIKTIEKLLQVKISDSSIILYLHYCSEVIIRQYSNVTKKKALHSKSLEKVDKVTPQVVCFISLEHF